MPIKRKLKIELEQPAHVLRALSAEVTVQQDGKVGPIVAGATVATAFGTISARGSFSGSRKGKGG
jgi:hypothetical protein